MSTDNPRSGWWRGCAVAATPAARTDRVSVEMLFVVVFQQPGAGQLAIGQPQQPARPARGTIQESATDDSIADIHAHDRKELRRRGVEIVRRAVIKVPIEHEVSGENTAAGYRGDVCHLGQKASVPQKTDQPEMI